jgi:hypothetical protein
MADYDKDMAEERIQIKDDKQKIYQDDKEKRDTKAKMMPDYAPKAMDPMHNGKPGVQQDDFEQFSNKGPKNYGEDHGGPKMTEDPKSYRSSMSKHWHQSNLLSENPIVNHATEK